MTDDPLARDLARMAHQAFLTREANCYTVAGEARAFPPTREGMVDEALEFYRLARLALGLDMTGFPETMAARVTLPPGSPIGVVTHNGVDYPFFPTSEAA